MRTWVWLSSYSNRRTRQLSARGPLVHEVPEALKLVEDDQVRLQCIETGVGQEPPKLRDESATLLHRFLVTASRDTITHAYKFAMQWPARAAHPHRGIASRYPGRSGNP